MADGVQVAQEVKLYCLCRTTDENNMIGCDKCEEWYHFACVGIDPVSLYYLKKFILDYYT